jgi:hypothetical protein
MTIFAVQYTVTKFKNYDTELTIVVASGLEELLANHQASKLRE